MRSLRRAAGVKQKDAAKEIGVTNCYLSLIEKGKRCPSIEVVEKYANVLGLGMPIFFLLMIEREDCTDKLGGLKLYKSVESLQKTTLQNAFEIYKLPCTQRKHQGKLSRGNVSEYFESKRSIVEDGSSEADI